MNPDDVATAIAAAVRDALADLNLAAQPAKLLYTCAEASELTGLPKSFFEEETAAGHIPSRKIGRARRMALADIEAVIEAGYQPATSGPYLRRFKAIEQQRRLAAAA